MNIQFLKQIAIIIFIASLLPSCNSDDEQLQPEIITPEDMMDDPVDDDTNDTDSESLDLTFTLRTEQDQICDFAFNKMAVFNDFVHSYYGGGCASTEETPFNLGVWHSEDGIAWVGDSSFASERRGHSLTEFNGDLFLIGGADNDDNELEEVWVSNDGFLWTLGADILPFGSVSFHNVVVFNDQLYLITDDYEDDDGTQMMAIYRSDDGFNWDLIATDIFPVRTAAEAVVFDNHLYVIGGGNTSTASAFNDIWRSNDGVNWTSVTPSGEFVEPILGHTLTEYEGRLWLIGGTNNEGIWYTQDGIEWNAFTDAIPYPIPYGHNTLIYNEQLWVFGGVVDGQLTGRIFSIQLND